jgi:surface antigen
MRASIRSFVPVILAASLLGGCSNDYGPKQTGGAVLGGIGGGLAGAQFGHGSGKLAATAIGTLLGVFVGSEAGRSLDRADQAYAHRAEQTAYAAPVGQTITWNNPESGHAGTFTPTRDGYDQGGGYCREYQSTVTIGGQNEHAYGTACRQPDGSWKVVK